LNLNLKYDVNVTENKNLKTFNNNIYKLNTGFLLGCMISSRESGCAMVSIHEGGCAEGSRVRVVVPERPRVQVLKRNNDLGTPKLSLIRAQQYAMCKLSEFFRER
jgi:hypothetical protein